MLVGVEGTGAYEAGLAGHLREQYVAVVEIDHPDRNARRRQGKSDPVDAEGAARAALAQCRTGILKQRDGRVMPCGACASPAAVRSANALTCQYRCKHSSSRRRRNYAAFCGP